MAPTLPSRWRDRTRRCIIVGVGVADNGSRKLPSPAIGATFIAGAVVVLLMGMTWLGEGEAKEQLIAPDLEGVTPPTDPRGEPIELPPSQPATAVTFGVDGQVLRPDPVRARIVDESGDEIIITLPPDTTVDSVTGEVVPTTSTPTSRAPGSTSPPPSSPTTPTPTTSAPPPPTSSPTTQATTTTTAPATTTTTESTTTTTDDPGMGLLDGIVGVALP